jgi:hypothetical protein
MTHLAQFANPSIDSLGNFMAILESLKQDMLDSEWREFTKKDLALRKWRYFLALDPYTRWGLVKPRGYPGDATLMDFAYKHPSVQHDITSSGDHGQAIFNMTAGAKQSQSARQRIQLIAGEIESKALSVGSKLTIMSFASGHARELQGLSSLTKSRIREFIALDTDPVSLDEVAKSVDGIEIKTARHNVIKEDLSHLPAAQLVYSLGLFDYLNEEYALAVLAKMWKKTLSGGTTIIANLAPTAANLGYCEAIMDWWMIPRTESDFRILADNIGASFQDVKETSIQQHGCFNYLRMERS